MAATDIDRTWEFTRLLNFDSTSPRVSREVRDCCHVINEPEVQARSAPMREMPPHLGEHLHLATLTEAARRGLLGQAVERGDVRVVTLLTTLTSVRDATYRGAPLLHLAVAQGHDDVAEVLIRAGADVDSTNSLGETAMWVALTRGKNQLKAVTWLIQHGASINQKSSSGKTALHVAASCCPDAVAPLVAAGSDVSAREGCRGDTPLHLACAFCHPGAVWALLQAGAHAQTENFHGETPLARLLAHAHSARDFHARQRRDLARRLMALGFRLRSAVPATGSDAMRKQGRDKMADVHRALSIAQTEVPSLQELSRMVVRELLPVKDHAAHVRQLEIPRHLQAFLCFRN